MVWDQLTGIDLPDESTGFIPKDYDLANYITNSFGQFDNYTPIAISSVCSNLLQMMVSVWLLVIVEGIYGNNDKGGLGRTCIQSTATVRDE